MKQSPFFEFFNRRASRSFDNFMAVSSEDVDFINWNDFTLALDYGDAEYEYTELRQRCALFDVSPIRKIRVTGPAAGRLFDYVLTRPVSGSPSQRGIYVAFCDADGLLKDDSILYKFADDDYLFMPSDIDHSDYLVECSNFLGIDPSQLNISECTDDWHGVAIQGPASAAVLDDMGFSEVATIKPFEVRDFARNGSIVKLARMGFTADLGYELWFEPQFTPLFKNALELTRSRLSMTLPGYGLSALEACRLEGGFIVAGWDFSTEADPDPDFQRSPFEVGLGWLVDLKKADFVGRDALLREREKGQRYVLKQFKVDKKFELKSGDPVYADVDGVATHIGIVNCSSWSWGLAHTIGNLSIFIEFADQLGAWLLVDGQRVNIELTKEFLLKLERRNRVPSDLLL
jgi:aminomethyltransferase